MAKTPDSTAPDLQTETETPVLDDNKTKGDLVEIVITKFGEGKVSTGVHVTGEGDIYAVRGDKLFVAPHVAQALEVLGRAEIV